MERLDDRVLLSVATPSQNVVDAFAKIESAYVSYSDANIKLQGEYLRKKLPGRMKSGTIAFFLKIDADLFKIDTALIGTPSPVGAADATTGGSTGGKIGIDQALLKLDLSQDQIATIEKTLIPAVQSELDATVALQNQFQQASTSRPGNSKWGNITLKRGFVDSIALDLGFRHIEAKLIALDPANVTGPSEQMLLGLDSAVVDTLAYLEGDPDQPIITGQTAASDATDSTSGDSGADDPAAGDFPDIGLDSLLPAVTSGSIQSNV